MGEDKKHKVKIIVLVILVIILIALCSVLVYRKVLNNKSSNLLINSAKEDLASVKENNEIDNKDEKENTNTDENADVTNESNNKYGVAKIETPITMNGNKYNVEAEMSFVDWEYSLEAVFKEEIDIKVNGKNIDSFQIYAWTQAETLNYQLPEIRLLSDANSNKEYLMVVANNYIPSYSTAVIKIYDENGNIIADLDDWGKTEVKLKENSNTIPRYRIYTDAIRIIEPLTNGGANMHEYTVEDRKLKDEIIEEYSADEIEQVKKD